MYYFIIGLVQPKPVEAVLNYRGIYMTIDEVETTLPRFKNIPLCYKHVAEWRIGTVEHCQVEVNGDIMAHCSIDTSTLWGEYVVNGIISGKLGGLSMAYPCGVQETDLYMIRTTPIVPTEVSVCERGCFPRSRILYIHTPSTGHDRHFKIANHEVYKKNTISIMEAENEIKAKQWDDWQAQLATFGYANNTDALFNDAEIHRKSIRAKFSEQMKTNVVPAVTSMLGNEVKASEWIENYNKVLFENPGIVEILSFSASSATEYREKWEATEKKLLELKAEQEKANAIKPDAKPIAVSHDEIAAPTTNLAFTAARQEKVKTAAHKFGVEYIVPSKPSGSAPSPAEYFSNFTDKFGSKRVKAI